MNYQGIVIQESLHDQGILANMHIIETKIVPVTERHQTPWVKQWTMHTVSIPGQEADQIAQRLSASLDPNHADAWYVDFKNDSYHYVIYAAKVFKVDLANPVLYKEAKQYGIGLGIPEHQVDFT